MFVPGAFDITEFKVLANSSYVYFRISVRDLGGNPWDGPNGFSLQYIHIYLLTTANLPKQIYTYGLNVIVDHGWHYAILVAPGWGDTPVPNGQVSAIYRYDLKLIADEYHNQTLFDVYVSGNNTIEVKVSTSLLEDVNNLNNWIFVVAMAGYDGSAPMKVRAIKSGDPDQWTFGGGNPDALAAGVHPLIIDLLAPTAQDQYDMLGSYNTTTGQLARVRGVTSTGGIYTPPPTMTTITETVTQTSVVTTTEVSTTTQVSTTTATVTQTTTFTTTGVSTTTVPTTETTTETTTQIVTQPITTTETTTETIIITTPGTETVTTYTTVPITQTHLTTYTTISTLYAYTTVPITRTQVVLTTSTAVETVYSTVPVTAPFTTPITPTSVETLTVYETRPITVTSIVTHSIEVTKIITETPAAEYAPIAISGVAIAAALAIFFVILIARKRHF